jgi:hypothetical protein
VSDDYVEGDPSGAPAEDGYTEQPAEEAPRSYLDLDDDLANRYVRVKVDGVDEEVPLREALSGYSRTADYTRKTQELSQQRQEAEYALAVQRALQASPEETLRLLGRQYGLNLDQPQPAAVERSPYEVDEDIYLSPVEKRLAEVELSNRQIQERWEQERAEQHLQASIGDLKQRYQADDAIIREVVGVALQNGRGPESFDMIYKSVAFDRAVAARQQALAAQQANDRQRQAAGANASQLIGNGASATRAAMPAPDTSERNLSLTEAFDQAWNNRT